MQPMPTKPTLPPYCANASLGMARMSMEAYIRTLIMLGFLLVIDAHSRWMEVEAVHSASTQNTVEHFHSVFARFGLPDHEAMVTDNGTCFTSSEFAEFARRIQICHVTCTVAPYQLSPIIKWASRKGSPNFQVWNKEAD